MTSSLRGSSQERAYRYIKSRILDHRFPVSCRLRAQELAEQMALSRTPVREALGRLEQEGLVRREGGWGFAVRELSLTDIIDLFDVREALELQALSVALPRIDHRVINRLREHLDEAEAALLAGRPADSLRHARHFHSAISQAGENALLTSMLDSLNDRIHRVGLSLAKRFPARPREVLEENRALLNAIEQRDSRRATRLLRQHIRRSRELLLSGGRVPS